MSGLLRNFLIPVKSKLLPQWRPTLLSTRNSSAGKDVMLFKYENPKFFRNLNIFGFTQFVFWTYLSTFAMTLRDTPVDKSNKNLAWYEKFNLGENKYRNGLCILFFGIGYGILTLCFGITLRSVRYLILRPDRKNVAFVVYTPMGKNRIIQANLVDISAQQHRQTITSYLPIKVRGKMFYFLLDKRGEFPHPGLFDSTAGMKRKF